MDDSAAQARIRDARISYERGTLDEACIEHDPFGEFALWLDAAIAANVIEPNGMTVATVSPEGRPSARIVLLRGYDERGFTFFTNYESGKGRDLAATGHASLLWWWGSLERQIRVEGAVERLEPAESDVYFMRRPRGHRLSAWASAQSTRVPDRAYLEAEMARYERDFAGREVDRPPYWGGFRVVPERFEFWQGRRNRVHDRIVYERDGAGWRIVRLAP